MTDKMTRENMWTTVHGIIQINEFVAQAGGSILGFLGLEEAEEIAEAFEEIAAMIDAEEAEEGRDETAASVRAAGKYIAEAVRIHG